MQQSQKGTPPTEGGPHSAPPLCKQRTQNRATGAVAGSQRAQAQPRYFRCDHEVPAGLRGSPRGSCFLPLGRGGWLPPHPIAARLTRGALHPATTPQPPFSHRFCPAPGMRRAKQRRSDETYGGEEQHLRELVLWHWDTQGQRQVLGEPSPRQTAP